MPPELEAPTVSPVVASLWETYHSLMKTRQSGGFGPQLLTYTELLSWQRAHRVRLLPWECETLIDMDHASMSVYLEK